MQFSALFSYMLWHIEFKFCIWLGFNVPKSKFECRHFASIFVGVMPLCELRILEIHSFPHFSLSCFDILRWNFVYDFVLLYYRSSSSVVNLRQFFVGVMPLLELRILEIHSFPHFSLSCFDILRWNFAYDFVLLYYRSSSSVVNLRQFFVGVMPLLELRILEIHSFPHFSLSCFDILRWNFVYDFVLLYYRSSSSVVNLRQFFVGVMPLLELRILEIHSFPHFSLSCFDILRWNFAYDFVLLYYRSSSSVVNLRQFLWESCPFWNLEYWKYTVFRTFLLQPFTYLAESLHITLFFCTTDQVWVSSVCVYFGVMPLFELRIL